MNHKYVNIRQKIFGEERRVFNGIEKKVFEDVADAIDKNDGEKDEIATISYKKSQIEKSLTWLKSFAKNEDRNLNSRNTHQDHQRFIYMALGQAIEDVSGDDNDKFWKIANAILDGDQVLDFVNAYEKTQNGASFPVGSHKGIEDSWSKARINMSNAKNKEAIDKLNSMNKIFSKIFKDEDFNILRSLLSLAIEKSVLLPEGQYVLPDFLFPDTKTNPQKLIELREKWNTFQDTYLETLSIQKEDLNKTRRNALGEITSAYTNVTQWESKKNLQENIKNRQKLVKELKEKYGTDNKDAIKIETQIENDSFSQALLQSTDEPVAQSQPQLQPQLQPQNFNPISDSTQTQGQRQVIVSGADTDPLANLPPGALPPLSAAPQQMEVGQLDLSDPNLGSEKHLINKRDTIKSVTKEKNDFVYSLIENEVEQYTALTPKYLKKHIGKRYEIRKNDCIYFSDTIAQENSGLIDDYHSYVTSNKGNEKFSAYFKRQGINEKPVSSYSLENGKTYLVGFEDYIGRGSHGGFISITPSGKKIYTHASTNSFEYQGKTYLLDQTDEYKDIRNNLQNKSLAQKQALFEQVRNFRNAEKKLVKTNNGVISPTGKGFTKDDVGKYFLIRRDQSKPVQIKVKGNIMDFNQDKIPIGHIVSQNFDEYLLSNPEFTQHAYIQEIKKSVPQVVAPQQTTSSSSFEKIPSNPLEDSDLIDMSNNATKKLELYYSSLQPDASHVLKSPICFGAIGQLQEIEKLPGYITHPNLGGGSGDAWEVALKPGMQITHRFFDDSEFNKTTYVQPFIDEQNLQTTYQTLEANQEQDYTQGITFRFEESLYKDEWKKDPSKYRPNTHYAEIVRKESFQKVTTIEMTAEDFLKTQVFGCAIIFV